MTITSRRVLVLVAAAVATVVATVVASTLAAAPATAAPAAPVRIDVAARARSEALTGYRVLLTGGAHRLSTTVTVPTVTCPATGSGVVSVAVYLGGREFGSTRADLAVAFVDADCDDGRVTYGVFAATAPVFAGALVPVAPGDLLTLTVATSRTSSTATVADARGRSLASSTDVGLRPDDAQVTVQGGLPGAAVPGHSTVAFTRVRLDAAALLAADPRRLTQVAADGSVVASASALTGAGDAFTVRQRRRA